MNSIPSDPLHGRRLRVLEVFALYHQSGARVDGFFCHRAFKRNHEPLNGSRIRAEFRIECEGSEITRFGVEKRHPECLAGKDFAQAIADRSNEVSQIELRAYVP